MSSDAELPDKLYFKIGEVARLVGVKPYVLRYWESEFASVLRPGKTEARHRLYRRKDVELILEIKRLLYEKRYTLEGARKFLEGRSKGESAEPASRKTGQPQLFQTGPGAPPILDEIRRELRALLEILK